MCIKITTKDGSIVTIKAATGKKTFGVMSRILNEASDRISKETPARIVDRKEFQL